METSNSKNAARFKTLWLMGIFVHISVLFLTFDIYFKSPILNGMAQEPYTIQPIAKRCVLFIADGLRAESIYKAEHFHRAPYLNKLRKTKSAAWGTVHTRVPTESRPGHIAILSGIYEDPSAILTGWQYNLQSFDSLINTSNRAWSYGSPDIVHIFKKTEATKQTIESYDPNDEDFSGKTSTIQLDTWVFDKMKTLLKHKENTCSDNYFKLQDLKKKTFESGACAEAFVKCIDDMTNCKFNRIKECDSADVSAFHAIAEKIGRCKSEDLIAECGELCEGGNLFFLHLLGMDSVGHIFKPNSIEFVENIAALDAGVEDIVNLVSNFYNDNETVFVLTADHGMTDWGSHGDGTNDETDVPFMMWGKGTPSSLFDFHMKQAEITPLIASLIGISIPVNSVGILNRFLLNGTEEQISHAVFNNVKQILNQYRVLNESFARDPFFKNYGRLSNRLYVEEAMKTIENLMIGGGDNLETANNLAAEFINELIIGMDRMRNYYYVPKIFAIGIGFVLWMITVLVYIHNDGNKKGNVVIRGILRIVTLIASLITLIILKVLGTSFSSYGYAVFIFTIWIYLYEFNDFSLQIVNGKRESIRIIIYVFTFGAINQMMAFSFDNRLFCCPVMCALGVWIFKYSNLSRSLQYQWLILCSAFVLFNFTSMSTNFSYELLVLGYVFWIVMYTLKCMIPTIKHMKVHKSKYMTYSIYMVGTPLVVSMMAFLNALLVAKSFDAVEGVNSKLKTLSWTLTGISLVMIPLSSRSIISRFGHVSICLLTPVILMGVCADILVYTALVWLLYTWISIEGTNYNRKIVLSDQYYTNTTTKHNGISFRHYRICLFFLSISISYLFAVGNIASFNGFDPLWTRAYVSIFNRGLMGALIVIKICLPLLTITCAFHAINTITDCDLHTMFAIITLFCDQLVFNFLMRVKNEGSWKDIGESLSHFVIIDALVIIILIFYFVAKKLTEFGFTKTNNLRKDTISYDDYKTFSYNVIPPKTMRHRKNNLIDGNV